MAHASIRKFNFEFVTAAVGEKDSWWRQLRTRVLARLAVDTPPSQTALAFAYSHRALPVPRISA